MIKTDILTDQQTQIRDAEREALRALVAAIEPLEPAESDVGALKQADADLEELFLLVVVGEFNAGKSAFINALLGQPVLPEGVTPVRTALAKSASVQAPTSPLGVRLAAGG